MSFVEKLKMSLVFLECLKRHAKEEHVEWFYHVAIRYVAKAIILSGKRDYQLNIEIRAVTDDTDIGDELFDTMYGVEHELKLERLERKMTIEEKDGKRRLVVHWVCGLPIKKCQTPT